MDYSVDRRFSMIVTLLTVLTIVDLRAAHARQCYVCGIGPTDPLYDTMLMAQRGASGNTNATATGGGGTDAAAAAVGADRPQPADCALFERTDANVDAYVVECPAGYMGCFTQSDGITIVRTCNRYSIDDCKTANRVTYCYCNSDRCNGRDQPATQMQSAGATNGAASPSTTKRQQPFFHDRSFDDEDDDVEDDDEGDDDDDDGGTFEASGHSALDDRVETRWSADDTSSTTTSSTLSSTLAALNEHTSVPTTTMTAVPPHTIGHNHRSRVGSGSISHIKTYGSPIAFIPVCLTAFGFGLGA